ncbi:MAG: S1 RNA-binding domain-containing protein, partial [Clostridia bacterium]|nr:S1 RNA-binding domain-containing protein [Clostridia bacterium]
MAISVGSIVEGVVTGITKFGAFVELPNGAVGLVHISEVADTYVKDVKDYLKEKEKVMVKLINI